MDHRRGRVDHRLIMRLDLLDGTFRVRVIDRDVDERGFGPDFHYEGDTTFGATPLPKVARYGNRWLVEAACLPGVGYVVAEKGPTSYRSGGSAMDEGDGRFCILLLDRHDPLRPYGPDGPTVQESLEMAVETFAVTEGIDKITFR